jgi:4-amino-4-deoxy-L-arabinose transferase-like glycosyltransferase
VLYAPWDPKVQANSVLIYDAYGYHNLALCIIEHHTFCGDTFRTPGYPFFIAMFYSVVGLKPWVVLLAQNLVDLASIYLVFRIGELLFSRRVGLVAAAFLAIDPNAILATTSLCSDNLFVALLLAAIYFYLRGILQSGTVTTFLTAGAALGLAALVRPAAQYYLAILLLVMLLWPVSTIATRARWSVLFALAFLASIAPWIYRNYALYDAPRLSSIQGENFLFWQVTYARAWELHRPGPEIAAEYKAQAEAHGYAENGNPFVNEAIAQKLAFEYIKTHPIIYGLRWISGMVHTYTNLNTGDIAAKLGLTSTPLEPEFVFASESQAKLVADFFRTKSPFELAAGVLVLSVLLINYSTFLLGTVILVRRRQWIVALLFMMSIFYFTVIGGPIGLARFRLPIAPFYLIVGAVYIDYLLDRLARSQQPAFG